MWSKQGLVVYWGTVGFSLRTKVGEKLQTVIEAYPEWAVSLVRQRDLEKLAVTEAAYTKYGELLASVPHAKELLSSGKKYIKHNWLTAENLATILQASTELIQGQGEQPPERDK